MRFAFAVMFFLSSSGHLSVGIELVGDLMSFSASNNRLHRRPRRIDDVGRYQRQPASRNRFFGFFFRRLVSAERAAIGGDSSEDLMSADASRCSPAEAKYPFPESF